MDLIDYKILECLKENSRQNATDIGPKINLSTSAVIERIKKLEQELGELESKLEINQEKRKTANGVAMTATAEFNKKVESYLKRVELNDDGDRIIKYANIANKIIEKYRVALQRKKVAEVALTMTKCYKLLASKKTLIERIPPFCMISLHRLHPPN